MDMMKLVQIQTKLNAPKGQFNKFGGYAYRSCEDILKAVKPLLEATECALTITDEIVTVGERTYVVATASLYDAKTGEQIASAKGWAREALTKKGMDESQITGSSSSYARKYSLNGLLAIDDSKDADTMDNREQPKKTSKPKDGTSIYRLAEWLGDQGIDADYFAALMFNCQFKDLQPKNADYCMKDLNYTLSKFQERMKNATEEIPME